MLVRHLDSTSFTAPVRLLRVVTFPNGIGLLSTLQVCCSLWLSVQVCTLGVAPIKAGRGSLENTWFMIHRYREATIALDDFGDSILNSMNDYVGCLLGVLLGRM